MFENIKSPLNLFLISYGLILWIGFFINNDFFWFSSIFQNKSLGSLDVSETIQKLDGSVGIFGLISIVGYFYFVLCIIWGIYTLFLKKIFDVKN